MIDPLSIDRSLLPPRVSNRLDGLIILIDWKRNQWLSEAYRTTIWEQERLWMKNVNN